MALPRVLVRLVIRFHAWVYRATGGRIGGRFGSLEQVLVTTTGRRTGVQRTTPLMVTPVGERLVLIASYGGAPHHPAWYLNLVDNPEIGVQRGRERFQAVARTATGAERERLWAAAVAANPGYAEYQRKTDRQIPVVVVERPGL